MLLQSRVGSCLLDWEIALVKSAVFEVVQVDRPKLCVGVCVRERKGIESRESISTLS